MLRYGTDEYRSLVENNRQRQTEFLNEENQVWLDRIFQDKGVKRNNIEKLKIEVGLHELVLNMKEKKKAKNGQDVMVIKFWKPPRTNMKGVKESYDPISCYHMLQKVGRGVFEEEWFKPFTTCLSEQDFDRVEKGMKVRCLVRHKEKYFTEKDGTIKNHERGYGYGKPIIIREASIYKIVKEDNPEIDYLQLFIPLNYGTNNL